MGVERKKREGRGKYGQNQRLGNFAIKKEV